MIRGVHFEKSIIENTPPHASAFHSALALAPFNHQAYRAPTNTSALFKF
jgi:hypothetical protein